MNSRAPVLIGVLMFLAVALFTSNSFSKGDYFPFSKGSKSVVEGMSPYSHEVDSFLRQNWEPAGSHRVAPVVAYPLPALFVAVPLLVLPESTQITVWLCLSLVMLFFGISWNRSSELYLLLPVVFYPVLHAAQIQTPSVLWTGLAALVCFGLYTLPAPLLGFLLALLPWKPQVGLLFALAGAVIALRERRAVFHWWVGWLIAIVALSLLLQPDWIAQWLAAVDRYRAQASTYSLFPWGLAALALAFGMPWYVVCAVAQVVLFPVNDLYSVLPIIIAWRAFRAECALPAAAVTWLALVVYGRPNAAIAICVLALVPLAFCCALVGLGRLKRYEKLRLLLNEHPRPRMPHTKGLAA